MPFKPFKKKSKGETSASDKPAPQKQSKRPIEKKRKKAKRDRYQD